MKTLQFLLLAFALCLAPASASVIYSNTESNTFITAYYSQDNYLEIGDRITLAGADRQVTSARLMFYNAGLSTGTFDAILRFYQVGGPVGPQIGGDYSLTGLSIGSNVDLTVVFNNLNLDLTGFNEVIFTVAVLNVSNGLDLGLDFFESPNTGIGSSDALFYIVRGANGFTTSDTKLDIDNLYFELQAQPVPEPSTVVMISLAGAALWFARRRVAR
jgi:hypothetical protein